MNYKRLYFWKKLVSIINDYDIHIGNLDCISIFYISIYKGIFQVQKSNNVAIIMYALYIF